MLKKILGASILAMFCSVSAWAGEISVAAKVGTTGLGADVGYKFNPLLKARLGVNYLKLARSVKVEKINYDMKMKSQGFGLFADFYPFMGSLRLTAGIYKPNLQFDIDATGSGSYEIQGNTYNAATLGKLTGSVKWDKVAPYLGIGYETGSFFGFSLPVGLAFDLGAMHIGKPSIDYNATGAAANPYLQNDINKERKEVENQLGNAKWYPVVSAGVIVRF